MIIIDLEAAGLLEDSHPIEVAWGAIGGDSVASYLIKPETAWTHWSSESEKVHGISRDQLQAHGIAAGEVARRVHADLIGKLVYSDAPDFDQKWLNRLLSTAFAKHDITIGGLEMLWLERLLPVYQSFQAVQRQVAMAKKIYAGRNALEHRAGSDVRYLIGLHEFILRGL